MIMSILSAVVVLGLLIFLHELGHFAVAKWSGVMVQRFSLGFGPRLLAWTSGDTEYAISAVPLGGYVKMLGEDPEEEVPASEAMRAFSHQALWKRFLIVVAGPAMNLITACVAFSLVFAIYGAGSPSDLAKIGGVVEGMAASKAGLARGDAVLAIDAKPIARSWS